MSKKPTLKDIAAICNCSVTTASRALKNSSTISVELRKKVHETAKELGYIPNALAESMRTGSTKTIAAIITDFRNPFFATISKYIEEYTLEKGYTTLFFTTNNSAEQEVSACVNALKKNVDGILLFPSQENNETVEMLIAQKIPFCVVGRSYEDISTNYVESDDVQGGYRITKYMIERGAKNILFINGKFYGSSARKREEGYRKAIRESGLTPQVVHISENLGETEKLIREIFGQGTTSYDGVLAFCDMMGFEAYHTLRKLNYSIPEDMLLAGFDGLQNDIIFPISLTSSAIDKKKMAECSVDVLLEAIENREDPAAAQPKQIVLDQTLVEGDTA